MKVDTVKDITPTPILPPIEGYYHPIRRSESALDLSKYFPDFLDWDELYLTFISLEPVAERISEYNKVEDTLKHLLIELAGIELGIVTPIWNGHRRGIVDELTDLVHSCDGYKGENTAAVKLVQDFINSLTNLPEVGWDLTSERQQQKPVTSLQVDLASQTAT